MAGNATPQAHRRGNKRAFLIAAVFGVVAGVLSLTYLRNAKSDGAAANIVTVPVIVATRDIPERTVIREGMIEIKQVPADTRHNLALTEKQAAVGTLTRGEIIAGEQVLRNKIADQVRDVGFSANIPQGKRGVAIKVDEVVSSGGLIGVGDFVDVIGVFEVHDPTIKNPACDDCMGRPRRYYSITVLQNVQVLAVAQKTDPGVQTGGDPDDAKKEVKELKSITVAVTAEQAQTLFQAQEVGTLRLSLRPFGDDEIRPVTPILNELPSISGR